MAKKIRILIAEIDYYIEIDWNGSEFPVVNDYVCIMDLCTEEQRNEFENMKLPKYLHADFPNTVEYLKCYRWQIVERCWLSNDDLSVNCRRVDPALM